jgi:hypothetical protein
MPAEQYYLAGKTQSYPISGTMNYPGVGFNQSYPITTV